MKKSSGFKSLVNIGINQHTEVGEIGKLKLVNVICLFSIAVSLLSVGVNVIYGSYTYLIFDLTCLMLFFVPIYLNLTDKQQLSKIFTVFLIIAAIMISTVVIGYQTFFKYTIIIPILLSSILLEDQDRWLMGIAHSSIFLFVALAESIYFLGATDMGRNIEESQVFDMLGYLAFILSFFVLLNIILKSLKNNQKDLMVYKKIFDFSREGIAIFDKNVTYQKQNKAHFDLLGFSDEELSGKTPAFHMGKEAFEAVGNEIIKQGSYYGEIVSKTKHGSKFIDLLVFLVPLEKNDFYLVGIKRDITDRKKIELQLVKNEKELKQVIATKDRFFKIIAHDLKSPFNSLIGFSDLLLDEGQEYSEADTKRYLTHINQLSVQTLIMLENLLEWSQMESGALVFHPQKIKIKEIFDETLLEMKNIAAQKKITLIDDYDQQLSCMADKRMLQVVIRNLVSNAIKYSESGKEVRLTAHEADDQLVITVSDEGVGMAPEVLKSLFNAEQKVSTPGTEREKGSGLGLVLCHEFIEKSEGTLTVQSAPGKGSDFIIHLPLN